MMSPYNSTVKSSIPDEAAANNGVSNAANCCARASSELKLYQAFIFSVPIIFTFVILFLFYMFYLRRRRVDWASLRMRTNNSMPPSESSNDLSRCELGVAKELREMLPIIVFMESFSVKDTQCSVCLGDYQPEDKLQQIPACGHTFHMDCIDLWLSTHTTCPLCRQSLLASTKSSHVEGVVTDNTPAETNNRILNAETGNETSHQDSTRTDEEPQSSQQLAMDRDCDVDIERGLDNAK